MFKKDGVHIKIKDCYDKLFVIELARKIKAVKTDFDVNEFTDEVNKTLEDLEFSKRMQVISNNLHKQFINYEEALTWLQKSANQGNADAFYTLAQMHDEGVGIEENSNKAAEYYLESAKLGNTKAQHITALNEGPTS